MVWNREAPNPGAVRLRWALLAAGLASLASMACVSYPSVAGVVLLGAADDGSIVAMTREEDYSRPGFDGSGYYGSLNGGLTWKSLGDSASSSLRNVSPVEWRDWRDNSVDTPRGRYTLDGAEVILVDLDGRRRVAYSTAYLLEDGNAWILRMATTRHGDGRILVNEPKGLIYDETSGNLVLAMEIQGVVVGTPGGEWAEVAVGSFRPADFTFAAKTFWLVTHVGFWITALTMAVSMTAAGLFASHTRILHLLRQDLASLVLCMLSAAVLLIAAVLLTVGTIPLAMFIWIVMLAAVAAIIALLSSDRIDGPGWSRELLTLTSALLTVSSSVTLLWNFGQTNDDIHIIFLIWFAIMAWALGLACLRPLMDELRDLVPVALSIAGMTGLLVLTFMLWLHMGITHRLAILAALALCAAAAIVLAAYVRRDQSLRKARWEARALSRSE